MDHQAVHEADSSYFTDHRFYSINYSLQRAWNVLLKAYTPAYCTWCGLNAIGFKTLWSQKSFQSGFCCLTTAILTLVSISSQKLRSLLKLRFSFPIHGFLCVSKQIREIDKKIWFARQIYVCNNNTTKNLFFQLTLDSIILIMVFWCKLMFLCRFEVFSDIRFQYCRRRHHQNKN